MKSHGLVDCVNRREPLGSVAQSDKTDWTQIRSFPEVGWFEASMIARNVSRETAPTPDRVDPALRSRNLVRALEIVLPQPYG
ncbi:hypothetical protein CH256_10925 [Rhodococcus sp. 05-2254-6]|nr:hypothetical protein CH256_10925 [Rhodococcus sp. 05-2254-6]